MSYEFHVGQKVVCIDNRNWTSCDPKPIKGVIYTIREVSFEKGEMALRFLEIRSTPTDWRLSPPGGEFFFQARYFRPLRERKTDISIFLAMLTPSEEKEDA